MDLKDHQVLDRVFGQGATPSEPTARLGGTRWQQELNQGHFSIERLCCEMALGGPDQNSGELRTSGTIRPDPIGWHQDSSNLEFLLAFRNAS